MTKSLQASLSELGDSIDTANSRYKDLLLSIRALFLVLLNEMSDEEIIQKGGELALANVRNLRLLVTMAKP